MTDYDRFINKVKVMPNDCWEWQGAIHDTGYPIFVNDIIKSRLGHRWSYWYHKGDPSGRFVCHSCDNRKCVNPDHLWLGDASDNMRDMVSKNRHKPQIGSQNNYAKLDEISVKQIKQEAKFRSGKGKKNSSNIKQIAEKYNVSYDTVRGIMRGVSWKHV